MSNKNHIDKVFDKYISSVNLHQSEGNDVKKQNRLFIAFANKNNSCLFSSELSNWVARNLIFSDMPWIVEAILPIPHLSLPIEGLKTKDIQNLIEVLSGVKKNIRFVAAIGSIEFGNHGAPDKYLSYGSTGPLVSSVMKGNVILSIENNWADEGFCDLMGTDVSHNKTEQIGDVVFYPYTI